MFSLKQRYPANLEDRLEGRLQAEEDYYPTFFEYM